MMRYVLRPAGNQYSLVGDCFLLGFMRETLNYDANSIRIEANGNAVPWQEITIV
jgi:hypothetical protein